MFRAVAFSALCILPIAAHAGDMYRCSVNGSAVYQEAPCTQGKGARVVAAPSYPTASDTALDKARQRATMARQKADAAMAEHCAKKGITRLYVGMDELDMACVPGYRDATTVNRTVTVDGESLQHVFRNGPATSYVYTRNGKVYAIQD